MGRNVNTRPGVFGRRLFLRCLLVLVEAVGLVAYIVYRGADWGWWVYLAFLAVSVAWAWDMYDVIVKVKLVPLYSRAVADTDHTDFLHEHYSQELAFCLKWPEYSAWRRWVFRLDYWPPTEVIHGAVTDTIHWFQRRTSK